MASTSYDELLRQVESLKSENSHLRRELQDNSGHLTQLEHEALNMKDVLAHLQLSMQEDANDTSLPSNYSFHSNDVSMESLDQNSNPGETDEGTPVKMRVKTRHSSSGSQKSQSDSQGGSPAKRRNNDPDLSQLLQDLERERSSILHDIDAEEKHRKWHIDQLALINDQLDKLPVTNTYNIQTDMSRRQLDNEATQIHEALQQSMGSAEQVKLRYDARQQRIHVIETEMLRLQQRQCDQQIEKDRRDSGTCDLNEADNDGTLVKDASTNTPTPGEDFVPRLGTENNDGYTSDRGVTSNAQGTRLITIATQTPDVVIEDHKVMLDSDPSTGLSIYLGAWPITKDLCGDGGFCGQETGSVMSFNSNNTNGSMPIGPQMTCPPQQLGTKMEMVYSLLSMLGTHDKDDMSRTLLAMSSSQDSCIAMRQSGCLPLLIQLLHGSDKDSGLLGNTRGSKAARARAAAALHNIVHSHPDDKRGRREARVLRLLEQIRAHCDQLQDEEEEGKESQAAAHPSDIDHHPGPAIAALMKLSFDEEHRHAICTLGGLQAIAELLQVDHKFHGSTTEQYNTTMRRYACMSLTNLTFGDGTNKALLCSMMAAMDALVNQLHSPNEDLCQVAASVLRNLSWRADLASKKTLREVGAVTNLIKGAMAVKKEATLKSILSALWNLSAHCSENKADICTVIGALEFLVGILTYKSPSKTLAIIENGGGVLRNVSSHIAVREDYRQTLRDHGCLQILLKHLRSPSLTIVSNACGTLWNLSARCQSDQQTLWEMGAVSMLRNLVHSKHKMISMGSSAALKNLLAARPNMMTSDSDKLKNSNMPSLHVRKQRAMEAEIDQNLSETCDNMDSPRDSPTEVKKPDKEPNRYIYSGDNCGIYQVTEPGPRRSMLRGPIYPRSGSGDSSPLLDNKIRSPQRVVRSGSQDSVGSVHSDISHDRTRAHNMLARSSKLLYERQGSSLERRSDGRQLRSSSNDRCGSPDRSRHGRSRIVQVMQEVAMHAGLEQNYRKIPGRNPAAMRDPMHRFGLHHTVPKGYNDLHPLSPLLGLSYSPDQEHESQDQPINYSMKQSNGPQKSATPNRPKVGNLIGSAFAPHHKVHRMAQSLFGAKSFPSNGHSPPGGADQGHPLHHSSGQTSQYNDSGGTDLDNDQPTDYSMRFMERGEEFTEQPLNYSSCYQDHNPDDYRNRSLIEDGFNEDCVKTFYTEGTPLNYLSTATSMTDLSANALDKSEDKDKIDAGMTSEQDKDETLNYGQKFADQGQPANAASINNWQGNSAVDGEPVKERPMEHHEPDLDEQEDQTKTFCVEGTPMCLTRTGSYSNLHSDRPDEQQNDEMGQQMQTLSGQTGRNSMENTQMTMDSESPCGAYKEHKTVTFDDNVEETPLMFSRSSSLGSLSSFDAQSIHSSVVSEYSRRASEVVSPSDLPDSPTETMPASPKLGKANNVGKQKDIEFKKIPAAHALFSSSVQMDTKEIQIPVLDSETFSNVPFLYATEDTPHNFSETSSLSALTFNDTLDEHQDAVIISSSTDKCVESEAEAIDDDDDGKDSSSMSEVSEGEEDFLAQCINSAMPNNNSRKMRRSTSDNVLRKKAGQTNNESHDKVPSMSGSTSKAGILSPWSKYSANRNSPLITANDASMLDSHLDDTPVSYAMEGGLESDFSEIPVSYAAEGNEELIKRNPEEPKQFLIQEGDTLLAFATEDTPMSFSNATSLSDLSVLTDDALAMQRSIVKSPGKVVVSIESSPSSIPQQDLKTKASDEDPLQLDSEGDITISFAAEDMPKQNGILQYSRTEKSMSVCSSDVCEAGSLCDQFSDRSSINRKAISVTDDNVDSLITYETEGTPLYFSATTSFSDLSFLTEDSPEMPKTVVKAQLTPPLLDDSKSDDSDENEELLTELIQSTMPKRKVSRKLEMIANAKPHKETKHYQSPLNKPNFQPQRPTSNLASQAVHGTDLMKSYAVEGTPNSFSAATSLSDLSVDSSEVLAHKKYASHMINLRSTDDSMFLHSCEEDTPTVYGIEGTPLSLSRRDSYTYLASNDDDQYKSGNNSKKAQMNPLQTQEQSFGVQPTPVCFSDNSSSSLIGSSNEDSETNEAVKVEDTPLSFSCNSSLSSLSMESSAYKPSPSDQALLDDCIRSAMPKSSRSSKDKSSRLPKRNSGGGSNPDKSKKEKTQVKTDVSSDSKSGTTSKSKETEEKSISKLAGDDDIFKKPPVNWRRQPHKSCDEILIGSRTPNGPTASVNWKRSHSQDSDIFLKQRKEHSNKEIAQGEHRFVVLPYSVESGFSKENPDNRLVVSTDSCKATASSNGSVEKFDSEKSDSNDNLPQFKEKSIIDAVLEQECSKVVEALDDMTLDVLEDGDAVEEEDDLFDELEPSSFSISTSASSAEPQPQKTEFEKALEENASLILSELKYERNMTSSNPEEDIFIENETISLVSNDYTSDTASEVSITWSTSSKGNSDQTSEYSNSTISQANSSNASQKGPRIMKPNGKVIQQQPVDDLKGIRGRRRPLYHNPRALPVTPAKSTSAKVDVASKPSANGRSTVPSKPLVNTPAKKVSPKGPQASSTPVKVSPKTSKLAKPSPVNNVRSGIPRSPNSKLNISQSKTVASSSVIDKELSSSKIKESPNERPKPPIKQGTFTKDCPSTLATALPIDINANETDGAVVKCNQKNSKIPSPPPGNFDKVTMREKRSADYSEPPDHRNSTGSSSSSRNSNGSQNESWCKALGSHSFVVNSTRENSFQACQTKENITLFQKTSSANKTNLSKPAASSNGYLTKPAKPPKSSGLLGNLKKAGSGPVLSNSSSGNSLNKSGILGSIRKATSKPEIKKSDSNMSLKKENVRPSTNLVRRISTSLNSSKNSIGSISSKKDDSGGSKGSIASNPEVKKPTGKKQVVSKIASLWKKDNSNKSFTASNTAGEKPPLKKRLSLGAAEMRTKPVKPPKPAGLGVDKPRIAKKSLSVQMSEPAVSAPREGMTKSSTYDKLDTAADVDQTSGDALNSTFNIDSGTYKKDKPDGALASLPNADETSREPVTNASANDSDVGGTTDRWRRHSESSKLSSEIWIKRGNDNNPYGYENQTPAPVMTTFGASKSPEKSQHDSSLTCSDTAPDECTTYSDSVVSDSYWESMASSINDQKPISVADVGRNGVSKAIASQVKQSSIPSPIKHTTKTEMLLARRRQSYLNNLKNENEPCDEPMKQPCKITTV